MSSNIKLMNTQNSNKNKIKNKTEYNKKLKNNSNNNNNNNTYIINKTNISLIKNPALFLKENKNYPLFSYEGGDGFQCVKFNLKPKQAIRADAGTMNYMTSNITINTSTGVGAILVPIIKFSKLIGIDTGTGIDAIQVDPTKIIQVIDCVQR